MVNTILALEIKKPNLKFDFNINLDLVKETNLTILLDLVIFFQDFILLILLLLLILSMILFLLINS